MTDQSYKSLRRFSETGLARYEKVMRGELGEQTLDAEDDNLSGAVVGTVDLTVATAETGKTLAEMVINAAGSHDLTDSVDDAGLWAWLTYVFRDQLFPKSKGVRKIGEYHKWYPAAANDFQKAQRHLIRMPVIAVLTLEDSCDHLLCNRPSSPGEVREQLTSQQDMFTKNFQSACQRLYYDEDKQTNRKGAAGKGAGSARRLAAVRKQLDVTWDMTDLEADEILGLLPAEFEKFQTESAIL